MAHIIPFLGRGLTNLFRRPTTEKFPKGEPPKAEPGYRGRLSYDASKCINCGMCEKVCAPGCMTRTQKPAPGGEPGDLEITFTFDLTSCTYCGLCADFCAKKCITLTDDYMITGTCKEDFLVIGSFIKKAPAKPKFTPEQIAVMKAAAEAKKKAAAEGGAAADAATEAPAKPKPKFTPEQIAEMKAAAEAKKKAAAEAAAKAAEQA